MSQSNRESRVEIVTGVNLNVAINTALLLIRVVKPMLIHRYSIIATSATGLTIGTALKLRVLALDTLITTDIPGENLDVGEARTRDQGVQKIVGEVFVKPGDLIIIASLFGAPGIANVVLEYWDLPFSGDRISHFRESA